MLRVRRRSLCMKADGWGGRHSVARGLLKRLKARAERRRARLDPACEPHYGRYRGWFT